MSRLLFILTFKKQTNKNVLKRAQYFIIKASKEYLNLPEEKDALEKQESTTKQNLAIFTKS